MCVVGCTRLWGYIWYSIWGEGVNSFLANCVFFFYSPIKGAPADVKLKRTKKSALKPIAALIPAGEIQNTCLSFIRSQRGAPLLVRQGFIYRCERKTAARTYWLCTGYKRYKCTGRMIYHGNTLIKSTFHIHDADYDRIDKAKMETHDLEAVDQNEFFFKNNVKR